MFWSLSSTIPPPSSKAIFFCNLFTKISYNCFGSKIAVKYKVLYNVSAVINSHPRPPDRHSVPDSQVNPLCYQQPWWFSLGINLYSILQATEGISDPDLDESHHLLQGHIFLCQNYSLFSNIINNNPRLLFSAPNYLFHPHHQVWEPHGNPTFSL